MWGAIIGGLIGAAGSYFGSKEEAEGLDAGARAQLEMFERMREDLAPYRGVGEQAINPLTDFVLGREANFGPGHPAFDAIADQYKARGKSFSGEYGRRLSEVYGETFRPMRYNELMGLVNVGQNSAAQAASGAMTTGANLASLAAARGGARADGISGIGNALGSLPWDEIISAWG